MVVVETPSEGKPSMGKSIRNFAVVTRVGLDLAKRVFQVHAVDAKGEIIVVRKLTRNQLIPFFAALPPCVGSLRRRGRALLARWDHLAGHRGAGVGGEAEKTRTERLEMTATMTKASERSRVTVTR